MFASVMYLKASFPSCGTSDALVDVTDERSSHAFDRRSTLFVAPSPRGENCSSVAPNFSDFCERREGEREERRCRDAGMAGIKPSQLHT